VLKRDTHVHNKFILHYHQLTYNEMRINWIVSDALLKGYLLFLMSTNNMITYIRLSASNQVTRF